MDETKVDDRLVRLLHEGCGALPEHLRQLNADLVLILGLLAEKAIEHEPTWALALASAAEVEQLQHLEVGVARRAARIPARSLEQVLTKLSIWQALEADGEEEDEVSLRGGSGVFRAPGPGADGTNTRA